MEQELAPPSHPASLYIKNHRRLLSKDDVRLIVEQAKFEQLSAISASLQYITSALNRLELRLYEEKR